MPAATDPVELLERAIGFTRGALGTVTDDAMARRTPCRDWNLGELLAHMADGLLAFTEASRGLIAVPAGAPSRADVPHLQELACTLLGAWSSPAARTARLGAASLESTLLLRVAALEIAVHGWDVARATGAGTALPEALAHELLPVAHQTITDGDRGVRFGPAVVPAAPGAGSALLAVAGRG